MGLFRRSSMEMHRASSPTTIISQDRLSDELRKRTAQSAQPVAHAFAPTGVDAHDRPPSKDDPVGTAILVVHGISPIQRYQIQDQYADGLLGYLNACESIAETGRRWVATVFWPSAQSASDAGPSALRLHLAPESNSVGDTAASTPTSNVHPHNEPVPAPIGSSAISDASPPPLPEGPYFDVYEGYWSPFTKNKTTLASLLQWLFNATFLATSSTAKLPAKPAKIRWDFGYVGAFLTIALGLWGIALWATGPTWTAFSAAYAVANPSPSPTGTVYASPSSLGAKTEKGVAATPSSSATPAASSAPPADLAGLVSAARTISLGRWLQVLLSLLLGYLLVQLVQMSWTIRRMKTRSDELSRDSTPVSGAFRKSAGHTLTWQRRTRKYFMVALAADGLALVANGASSGARSPAQAILVVALLVLCVGLVQAGRWLADFVVTEILGDVQVYTTHDCNSDYFDARERVIDAVQSAFLRVLKAERSYDRVHVAGHSLGSTVALDVMLQTRMLVEAKALNEADWRRIRSFLTFGTALEKTKFFFDVRKPTVSAAHDQWDADVYGRFFTNDPCVLAQPAQLNPGIYWRNVWYFRDVVANEITSYGTDIPLGATFGAWHGNPIAPRRVADNGAGPLEHPTVPWRFVHGDYLGDPRFWAIAGDLMRRG